MKTRHILTIMLMAIAASCTPDWEKDMIPSYQGSRPDSSTDREANEDTRKVMLLYSAGYNSLSSYLREDISDLCEGWLPRTRRADDVILVYSHLTKKSGGYKTPSSPVLFRLYAGHDGEPIRDTLKIYDEDIISSSAEQLESVLTYIKEEFPARSYGMVFSSHATGYLPAGFYGKPGSYIFQSGMRRSYGIAGKPASVPYIEPEVLPGMPAVKSIGQDVSGDRSYEMTLQDFAEAIPMKLDYILFDACLMGGIEVAYELAGKCDRVGFSQAEVLAEGFNYKTLASHLLGNKSASDPYSVCNDYFTQYDIQSGVYRSATISLVDCNRLEPLAEVCCILFEKYRDSISSIQPGKVQRFYRSSHHWFYDLESILTNAGITDEELQELHDALDMCIIYKGATPEFMNEFPIDTFCGFSMYLPSHGNSELDKFYRTLQWNEATGLIDND